MRAGVIIVAAGRASRMEGVDKQAFPLGGVPVLLRTLQAFEGLPQVCQMVVVARRALWPMLEDYRAAHPQTRITAITEGGESRQQSVLRGLEQLSPQLDYLAIHDGARPFAGEQLLSRCFQDARQYGAAAAAVPVKDTIKEAGPQGFIRATPDRASLYQVQTPQIFRMDLYRRAVEQALREGREYTDDCQLVERLGVQVYLSQGDYSNIKITTPQDLAVAQALGAARGWDAPEQTRWSPPKEEAAMLRTGHGYDVHRLVEGRKLILGGVEIPWERGLLGHSDADVLTHAVMDALLGAAALGDIGQHFPDTDPRYRGADSIALLRQVAALLARHGWRLQNLDATLLAQRPKLKDHIPRMRRTLAAACGVQEGQVSVKATTEEGLGFTGSGEGIAAHCVCLLERLPGESVPGEASPGETPQTASQLPPHKATP